MLQIIYAIIITTGLSLLIAHYDGLFNIFLNLRTSRLGSLFECAVCLSVYIAIVPTIGYELALMDYLVVVGASTMLTRYL